MESWCVCVCVCVCVHVCMCVTGHPGCCHRTCLGNAVRCFTRCGAQSRSSLNIFLWLPDRTEDRSGLVGKIITFWQRIGSRVFECGGNDGFGGFLRLNSILEKNSKTSFRDRWDRSLQTERTGPLRYTLEHFVTLASQTYLCALVAACTPPHTMHKPHTHTQTLLPMSSWVFQRCMMGGMHH